MGSRRIQDVEEYGEPEGQCNISGARWYDWCGEVVVGVQHDEHTSGVEGVLVRARSIGSLIAHTHIYVDVSDCAYVPRW